MKNSKLIAGMILTATLTIFAPASRAADTNAVASIKPDLLKTCPVSGDKLGEMAPPTVIIYKGQEVKFCCPDCKKDFDKDPDKYMAKIRAADVPDKEKADPADKK